MLAKYIIFRTVVDCGSLTRAAASLHLTQSGVSHALASLEAELGLPLLLRDRSGVILTDCGRQLLPFIKEILQTHEQLQQAAAAFKGLDTGIVRIGTFTSVSSHWLPEIIKNFNQAHPQIEIKLAEGDYDEIKQWILEGHVDFGFLSLRTAKDLETIPLHQDKFLCLLPPSHPLKRQKKIALRQLQAEPFILPKWGPHDDVRHMLKEAHIAPEIKYEVTEEKAIIAMVENGLGISILPEMALAGLQHSLHLIELEDCLCRTISLCFRPSYITTPAVAAFLAPLARRFPKAVFPSHSH